MRRLPLALLLLAAACGAPTTTTDGGDEPDGGPGGGAGGGAGGGGGVRRIVSLAVAPTQLFMSPGQEAPVAATATWDDNTTSDVTGTVTWTSTDPAAATVTVVSAANNDARVRAVAAWAADVTAAIGTLASNVLRVTVSGGDGGTGGGAGGGTGGGAGGGAGGGTGGGLGDGGVSGGELRAIWVTRFAYNTASDVRTIIGNAADGGYNVVYFQIRGGGDAFYQSSLVPWAQKLTGTLGQNPGWDPLQTAITEAHARGLQLHAYFNVFSAWSCSTAPYTCSCRAAQGQGNSCVLPPASPAGQPTHWLRANPQSMAVDTQGMNQDSEYYWFSPANAAYRAHVVAAVDELLTNYDVDGLHLDRIRYPGTWSSYDAASVSGFAAADAGVSRADWQRENVSSMVGAIYDVVKVRRPRALFSAAVWGIYTPLPGCNTSQGYGQYYQDSLNWVRTNRIDQLVPMTYWDIGTGCTDWARLTSGFVTNVGGPRVVAGMHALDQGTVQGPKLTARIQYARMLGAAGTAIFASSYFNASTWGVLRADGGVYAQDAGVPSITWR